VGGEENRGIVLQPPAPRQGGADRRNYL